MKKGIAVITLLIALVLSACQNPIIASRRPCTQANTKWVSSDGSISISVHYGNNATGEMTINDETVAFYASNDFGSGIHIFPIEAYYQETVTEEELEYWDCLYLSKRKFIATVKETTYFVVGQRITFHRIDE